MSWIGTCPSRPVLAMPLSLLSLLSIELYLYHKQYNDYIAYVLYTGEYGCVMAPSTTTKFALSTFPSIYNNSVSCVYYFLPRNRVKLTFLYLDIQSADCSKDRIEIYNGIQFNNPDIMICNGSVTVEFVSSSYIVVVRYIGTSLGRYRGFHALARYF